MMPSRQAEAHARNDHARLRAQIPAACPLLVERRDGGGFVISTLTGERIVAGRYEVAHACIAGFVEGWQARQRWVLAQAFADCVCRTPGCEHSASTHTGERGACVEPGCLCGPGGWS